MRALTLAALCLTGAMVVLPSGEPMAQAGPSKPPRVIAITKENAERSAAALAVAKSPFIGEPPPGKVIRAGQDWRNARAAMPSGETNDAPRDDQEGRARANDSVAASSFAIAPDHAQVQVIKPGKSGLIVETHIVPRDSAVRGHVRSNRVAVTSSPQTRGPNL